MFIQKANHSACAYGRCDEGEMIKKPTYKEGPIIHSSKIQATTGDSKTTAAQWIQGKRYSEEEYIVPPTKPHSCLIDALAIT